MRHLVADMKGQVFAPCIPDGGASTRLHRYVGLAMLIKGGLYHGMSFTTALSDVSGRECLVRNQIGGQRLVDKRCIRRKGAFQRRDRRQDLVFDLDQFGRVLGDIAVPRHHDSHRVAVKPHLADRQRCYLSRVKPFDWRRQPEAIGPFVEVLASEDAGHAWQVTRCIRRNSQDSGMGMRRPHETDMQRTRHDDVVQIPPLPGDEALVFLSRQRLADIVEVIRLVHDRTSRIAAAAFMTAATMFW